MKVAVIGAGYVGSAMIEFLRSHCEVMVYDTDDRKCFPSVEPPHSYQEGYGTEVKWKKPIRLMSERRQNQETLKNTINDECDIAFVCVPTPPREDGSCDVSIVEESIKWLNTPTIVIKSTVEPGTTDKLREETGKNIIFSPEFAGMSKYWSPFSFDTDMRESPWFIFGGPKASCRPVVDLYTKIGGPMKTYATTDAKTAEMVKYAANTFYATKVAFCSELALLCDKTGVEYEEMRELWTLDPRISKMHTARFRGSEGYAGACFPKDTEALSRFAQKEGSPLTILERVIQANDKMRNKGE